MKLFKPLERFFQIEAASGVLLLFAAVTALAWANSPWSATYEWLWTLPFRFGVGAHHWTTSLRLCVNEGLMTGFFLLAGLEIRREIHDGALSTMRQSVVPVAAAVGGVLAPALIYLTLASSPALQRGWAVPTATDIAFAIGVLSILGTRVPQDVRVLLLALAIIDDIVAILLIALFYTSGFQLPGLLIAGAGIAGVMAFQRLGVRAALAYTLPGAIVWMGLLQAGVHPTLTGVVLGLLTPTRIPVAPDRLLAMAARALDDLRARLGGQVRTAHELALPMQRLRHVQRELIPPVVRIQRSLHPWVAYLIMPLFALANAGIGLEGLRLSTGDTKTLGIAIILALVIGKPLGIITFAGLVTGTGLGTLSAAVNWRGVALVGSLGGIGFTMSLLIATLAFTDTSLLAGAKFAVLLGSGIAGAAGLLLGGCVQMQHRREHRRA